MRGISVVGKVFVAAACLTASVFSAGGSVLNPKWISADSAAPEKPAPVLAKKFVISTLPGSASFEVAVAGWCEVRVNGRKVGRDVLTPVTAQPDRRTPRLTLDVTGYLKIGENEIEVLLGNGWQNTFTKSGWGFPEAPWIGAPKISGVFKVDGKRLFVTDGSWRAYDSPIVFNALRNGEWYDARREGRRVNERAAKVEIYAPLGIVADEDAVPCREMETFEPVRVLKDPAGRTVYDFGANIAGWCEIEVEGAAGAKVEIDYDERMTPTNTPHGHIIAYIVRAGEKRPVQHDEYTLAGRGAVEKWHPRFTYHGFRYAWVKTVGDVRVKAIRARFVYSDFRRVGTLETSDKTFAALQAAAMRSYLSNFTGIPTDCPHREKNGWTGDAQLIAETGLWNFDARAGYVHFLRMLLDAQRPNGAVPCIAPCTPAFGFGWGSGPAWDAALFESPWQIYRFYGDDAPAREAYGAMKRYLAFILAKADPDGLIEYGLGDWCTPGLHYTVPVKLTDSAYVYQFCRRLAFWAARFGETGYAAECERKADDIRTAFNRAFHKGDGLYAAGETTSLAAPLFFEGLAADGMEKRIAERLVAAVRANAHKANFGILGAKWVPCALTKYGYIDDAWRLFVQPEFPGWANWLKSGDGCLWEDWDGARSRNHVMFGTFSGWAYEHVAGIVPLEPGFRKVAFRPNFPAGVESFSATHHTPHGEIKASWKRVNGVPVFTYSVPEEVEAVEPVP